MTDKNTIVKFAIIVFLAAKPKLWVQFSHRTKYLCNEQRYLFCLGVNHLLLIFFCSLQRNIIRVLNLWQKNNVFSPEVIQPLLDMADPNHPLHQEIQQQQNNTANGINFTVFKIIML